MTRIVAFGLAVLLVSSSGWAQKAVAPPVVNTPVRNIPIPDQLSHEGVAALRRIPPVKPPTPKHPLERALDVCEGHMSRAGRYQEDFKEKCEEVRARVREKQGPPAEISQDAAAAAAAQHHDLIDKALE